MKTFTKIYAVLIIVMISFATTAVLIPFFIPPIVGYQEGNLFVEASGWTNEISMIFWLSFFSFVVSLILLVSVVFVKGGLDSLKRRKKQQQAA